MNPSLIVREQSFSLRLQRTSGSITSYGIKWEGGDPNDALYTLSGCGLKTTISLPDNAEHSFDDLFISGGVGNHFGKIIVHYVGDETKKVYSKQMQITDVPALIPLFTVWLWTESGVYTTGSDGYPCDYAYRVKYPGFLKADDRCTRDPDLGLLGEDMEPEKWLSVGVRPLGQFINLPPVGTNYSEGQVGFGYFDTKGVFHLYDDGSFIDTGEYI